MSRPNRTSLYETTPRAQSAPQAEKIRLQGSNILLESSLTSVQSTKVRRSLQGSMTKGISGTRPMSFQKQGASVARLSKLKSRPTSYDSRINTQSETYRLHAPILQNRSGSFKVPTSTLLIPKGNLQVPGPTQQYVKNSLLASRTKQTSQTANLKAQTKNVSRPYGKLQVPGKEQQRVNDSLLASRTNQTSQTANLKAPTTNLSRPKGNLYVPKTTQQYTRDSFLASITKHVTPSNSLHESSSKFKIQRESITALKKEMQTKRDRINTLKSANSSVFAQASRILSQRGNLQAPNMNFLSLADTSQSSKPRLQSPRSSLPIHISQFETPRPKLQSSGNSYGGSYGNTNKQGGKPLQPRSPYSPGASFELSRFSKQSPRPSQQSKDSVQSQSTKASLSSLSADLMKILSSTITYGTDLPQVSEDTLRVFLTQVAPVLQTPSAPNDPEQEKKLAKILERRFEKLMPLIPSKANERPGKIEREKSTIRDMFGKVASWMEDVIVETETRMITYVPSKPPTTLKDNDNKQEKTKKLDKKPMKEQAHNVVVQPPPAKKEFKNVGTETKLNVGHSAQASVQNRVNSVEAGQNPRDNDSARYFRKTSTDDNAFEIKSGKGNYYEVATVSLSKRGSVDSATMTEVTDEMRFMNYLHGPPDNVRPTDARSYATWITGVSMMAEEWKALASASFAEEDNVIIEEVTEETVLAENLKPGPEKPILRAIKSNIDKIELESVKYDAPERLHHVTATVDPLEHRNVVVTGNNLAGQRPISREAPQPEQEPGRTSMIPSPYSQNRPQGPRSQRDDPMQSTSTLSDSHPSTLVSREEMKAYIMRRALPGQSQSGKETSEEEDSFFFDERDEIIATGKKQTSIPTKTDDYSWENSISDKAGALFNKDNTSKRTVEKWREVFATIIEASTTIE